ncbi:hypothetical protein DPSP01_012650 [Paraphaeosphaeria sporulosa]
MTSTSSSSLAQTPPVSGCETLTDTITRIETITRSGQTITNVITTIRATTLFDYDYLSPGTFEPTATELAPTSAFEPLPVETPTGQPRPTPQDPAQTSGVPVAPPNKEPQAISTPVATIPNTRPINIGPSHTAIFVPGIGPVNIAPGQITTFGTLPISFDTSASFIVIDNTQTIPLPAPTPEQTTLHLSSLLSNLQPGQATVVNGVTVSLDTRSFAIVVGSETIAVSAAQSGIVVPVPTLLPTDLSFVSASGGGIVLPNGETLAPGQATTYAGLPVSLASGMAGIVVVDGTVSIPVAGSTGGSSASSTTAAGDAQFTGGATPGAGIQTWWGECMMVAVFVAILPRR